MGAQQANALEHNPNQLPLVQVNQYRRLIHASIERVWENVLDWEHLPHLHDTSFDYVSLDTAGDWGWRTWSNPERSASVELVVNKPKLEYVARSYQGDAQVSEIWTRLTPKGDNTEIHVTFELPNVPNEQVAKLGEIFLKLYTRLWDEDEAMMVEREARLQRKFEAPGPTEVILDKPVPLPTTIQLGRSYWTLRKMEDELIVHSAICPHLLGPLDDRIELIGRTVTCPWHGYQFDVQTGECLGEADCRLKAPPEIIESKDKILIRLN